MDVKCVCGLLQESRSSFKVVDRPSAEVLTWPGAAHITKKSLLKSPVETTEAKETWNSSSSVLRKIAVMRSRLQMFPMMISFEDQQWRVWWEVKWQRGNIYIGIAWAWE